MYSIKTITCAGLLLFTVACAGDDAAQDDATQDTASDTAGAPASPAADALLDPNSATAEQLTSAGLDSAQMAALVGGRPYANMTAVDSVLQLDSARAEQVYARVWLPIDLNNASDEEILLIPGIGNRMLHEFKEYRPYTSIEQFRREIGKYVDDAEVARLEKYVSIGS